MNISDGAVFKTTTAGPDSIAIRLKKADRFSSQCWFRMLSGPNKPPEYRQLVVERDFWPRPSIAEPGLEENDD